MTRVIRRTVIITIHEAPGNYAVISSISATGFPYTELAKTFTVK